MARTFNGSSQYIYTTTAPLTGYPLTMACWFNVANVTADHSLMQLVDGSSGTHYHALLAEGTRAGDPVSVRSDSGGGASAARSTTSFSASTWSHACTVVSAANSRAAYLNGGGKGTNTGTQTFTDGTAIYIGVRVDTTLQLYCNGYIAEPAIWNVALTDAEVADLAKGFSPLLIRPESLVFYSPFIGQAEYTKDWKGTALTESTIPGTIAHPPIFRPNPVQQGEFYIATGGAPPSFTVPLYIHRLQQGFS